MNTRMIARSLRPLARTTTPVIRMGSVRAMSGSHAHENESFESFSARYEQFFGQVQDLFELQRGLNNCFAGSHAHENESFESFSARYEQFFGQVQDLFELQRGLNNCFAYDLVPSPGVVEAALRAARRVNDYSTAVRIFEGIKEKVENKGQYEAYLNELKGIREELGISTKEELYSS
ncbi:unnamed protein product [Rhizoctonia solani]|uniref:Cytochrome c oxidase subunit 6, mitochondrial n=1 Tax=Rhizoctonia solani TaxID=456999 RepID=A0A8H2XR45_9AGAM|nr:unnamed protein product [Rhizoctonia solani]